MLTYSKTVLINATHIRTREYLSNKCLTCPSQNKREHAFLCISYISYRNLGRLCYYIYVTEIFDDSVIIYILQKSWQDFCNIYITESSKTSVTYI
jgi:hypothetical protein